MPGAAQEFFALQADPPPPFITDSGYGAPEVLRPRWLPSASVVQTGPVYGFREGFRNREGAGRSGVGQDSAWHVSGCHE